MGNKYTGSVPALWERKLQVALWLHSTAKEHEIQTTFAETLLLCQSHGHISSPAGYKVEGCLIPTVIPGSAGSPAAEAAALYAAGGSLVDVHGVLHDHRHLGLQLSIADALFKELWEENTTVIVMGHTLQAMNQSQGTALVDGLSQVKMIFMNNNP